jgi:ferrous iron transport protein B
MKSILVIGNPNSGKTLLFNQLTGLSQHVANFPGVTVEIRTGHKDDLLFKDFPGAYSLQPMTKDEQLSMDGFKRELVKPETGSILYVADATRLERSLYLLLQLKDIAQHYHCPIIVAVNIIDEVLSKGTSVDIEGLEKALDCPVIAVSAKKGTGIQKLKKTLKHVAQTIHRESMDTSSPMPTPPSIESTKKLARQLAKDFGPQSDVLLKSQYTLDRIFLSSGLGGLFFLGIMLFLFQSIFSGAAPLMDFVSASIEKLGALVATLAPPGMVADFINDAIFGGIGSFLVFIPQIFILFFIIGLLEDSGYLARAAVICHRPLSWFGLSGRSFVPLLSGHACAIPAMMAARTIESPKKRLLTLLAIPFMACSARLPVYALLIGAFIPAKTIMGGLFGIQGLTFFILYAFGVMTGLIVSGLISKIYRTSVDDDAPFVVEMPPYRWPSLNVITRNALYRAGDFVKEAAGVIFTVTVIIWFLGYFPQGAGHLDQSFLGIMGRWIEPIFQPMGMDWKIGVAILTSFIAREVFVGTLGTLYGLENSLDNIETLTSSLQGSGFSIATACSLLVFYALAMQCVSTLAVLKKETGDRRLPIYVFIGMTLLAYIGAWLTFQIANSFFL